MAVALIGDRGMRTLNRSYRKHDVATDVLAFPAGDPVPGGEWLLGDLAVSVPAAARQAAERGHSLARELRILLLHGYLHLLGYDHEVDGGEMIRLEKRIVREMLPASRRGGS